MKRNPVCLTCKASCLLTYHCSGETQCVSRLHTRTPTHARAAQQELKGALDFEKGRRGGDVAEALQKQLARTLAASQDGTAGAAATHSGSASEHDSDADEAEEDGQ